MEQVYMKNTGAPHAHAPPRARAGRRRRRTVDGRASGRRGGRGGQCRSWNTLSLSLSLSLSSLLRIHGQKAAWIKNHLYKYERGSLRRRGPEPRRRSRAAGARSRGRSTLVIDAIGASQTLVIFGGQWKKKVREKEEREREREREGGKGGTDVIDRLSWSGSSRGSFFRVALIRRHHGSLGILCKMGRIPPVENVFLSAHKIT
jgi:hypothetical protein